MLYPLWTLVGGLLLVISETVVLRWTGVLVWAPQLAVMVVVYVALRRKFAVAAFATLLFATVADLCWGGPRGYYSLGLTATFFLMTWVRLRWRPRHLLSVVLLTLPAVLLTDAIALTSLALFRRDGLPLDTLLTVSPLAGLWTAVWAVPLAWVQLRIDRFVERRPYETVSL